MRDYQAKAIEAIRERAESGEPVPPVEVPAGSGKSDGVQFTQGIGRGNRPDADGGGNAK